MSEDESGRRVKFVARAYNVFAAEQVEGFALVPTVPGDGLSEDARRAGPARPAGRQAGNLYRRLAGAGGG